MSEPQLLAPCSFSGNQYELCTVDCVESNRSNSWGPDNGDQSVKNKLNALQQYFQPKCDNAISGRIIDIRSLEKGAEEVILRNDTPSVFLGIFLKALQKILYRRFRNSWDFIIVTGDINPHDGIIESKAVNDIKKKFKSVETHAEKYPGRKRLFLYVHEEGKLPIEPGWHNNDTIEVIAFSSNDSLEVILACVFEPSFNDEQKTLLDKASVSTTWEYVSTPGFEEMKQEALSKDWKGYFIYGEGESGKSALALALTKYLMETERIYAPVFVSLRNKAFVLANPIDERDPIIDYIASGISDFLGLDWKPVFGLELLRQALKKHRYLLVVDNLELDKADQVLIAIKSIITGCDPKTRPALILTSRFKWNNAKPYQDLGLTTKQAPVLTKKHIEELVYRVADGNSFAKNLRRDDAEYQKLTEQLYQYYNSLPGLITRIVPSLENEEPSQVQRKLLRSDPQSSIYSIIFSQMEPFIQVVIFAFIGLHNWLGEIEDSALSIKRQILLYIQDSGWTDDGVILKEWQLEGKINEALNALLRGNLIHQRKNEYFMKTHVYTDFMFSPDLKGKIRPNGLSTRETLIKTADMISAGLRSNQSADTISDLLIKLKKEETCMHYFFMHYIATHSNMPEYIELLIDNDFDINEKWEEEGGRTPLHCAAAVNQNIDMIKKFLEKGADIYAETKFGFSVISHAIQNPNTDILKLFIEKDRNLINSNNNGFAPLHYAALNENYLEAMRILLESGAEKNIANLDGRTPLLLAALSNENPAVIQFLIDWGADIYVKDYYGANLLHHAAMNPNPEIFTMILDRGFDINSKTGDGSTVLHGAACHNPNPAVIKILLENGADINAKDVNGSTPLMDAATDNENPEIAISLIKAGASLKEKNHEGKTALYFMEKRNDWPVIKTATQEAGIELRHW